MNELAHFTQDYAAFLAASPTSYHAVAEMRRRLLAAGFAELDETRSWDDVTGAKFFTRDGALVAWRTPATVSTEPSFRIIGSHTDSPALKLKPQPDLVAHGWGLINAEIYGGPILSSWLDRDLGLAGRLFDHQGEVHLVQTQPVARIPHVAPHLDRSINENLTLDRQQHLLPVCAVGQQPAGLLGWLCEQTGLGLEDLAGHDVFVVPTQPASTLGLEGELLAASRMDNLSSAYASLVALLGQDDGPAINVLAAFDHEEVGSATRSGAAGPLLDDALTRIAAGLGSAAEALPACYARSWCISADAAHGVHPHYAGWHDPGHRPLLNAGPVLKVNANQRYASDGRGTALWGRLCQQAQVKAQVFVSNNSVPCGSTIGPITATRLGIATVDVGIPLLSMHSTRELAGTTDLPDLTQVLKTFWAGA